MLSESDYHYLLCEIIKRTTDGYTDQDKDMFIFDRLYDELGKQSAASLVKHAQKLGIISE